jgi:RNA polymerase sigma-70 factor (ECF subfamily)
MWCEALYHAKAAELILYGRALGLSHAEAEDVLQETFVVLMQREERPTQPEHYCVRTYRNRALNHRRSLWRRLKREFEALRWFDRAPEETDAEREAMHCLAALPREQRETIVLKIWHQYTFEEIGELLETSPNTIAGRYRYGLAKLKACVRGAARQEAEGLDHAKSWATRVAKGLSYGRDERIGDTFARVAAAPPLAET